MLFLFFEKKPYFILLKIELQKHFDDF